MTWEVTENILCHMEAYSLSWDTGHKCCWTWKHRSLPNIKTAVPNLLAFYVITNRMLPVRLKKEPTYNLPLHGKFMMLMSEKVIALWNKCAVEKIFWNWIFGSVSLLGDFVVPNKNGVAPINTLMYAHFKNLNKIF